MRDYNLLVNGETIWQREDVDPALQSGNRKTEKTDTKTALHIESPPKGCPCTLPTNRYMRKICVHAAVPQSGESTLILANTLWRSSTVMYNKTVCQESTINL
jgi:hypothetical protein